MKTARARLSLYYQNNLLQSGVVRVSVARRAGMVPDEDNVVEIDFALTGTLRVQEACRRLGISKQRLGVLRQQALQAALEALAPGAPGRPRQVPAAAQEQRDALAQANERLRRELAVSQVMSGQADAQKALDEAASAWEAITNKFGADKQKALCLDALGVSA